MIILLTILLFINSKPTHIPIIIGFVFIGVSLPGFLNIPHPLLLVIGVFDKILGAVIYLAGFPLALLSMAWLVTDIIAIRIWNALQVKRTTIQLDSNCSRNIVYVNIPGYKI